MEFQKKILEDIVSFSPKCEASIQKHVRKLFQEMRRKEAEQRRNERRGMFKKRPKKNRGASKNWNEDSDEEPKSDEDEEALE